MNSHTIVEEIVLNTHVCINCGITFAFPADYEAQRRRDHRAWYCPNGHSQSWSQESKEEKADRLRREAEQALASRDEDLRVERLSHAATKGQLTKVKKRAEASLCPYGCKRSFVQMRRHIESKHPTEAAHGH